MGSSLSGLDSIYRAKANASKPRREAETDFVRTVVIKFASREDAKRWYNSPEYQAALPLRLEATEGTAVLVDEFVAPAG